jgi:hypothetical protein
VRVIHAWPTRSRNEHAIRTSWQSLSQILRLEKQRTNLSRMMAGTWRLSCLAVAAASRAAGLGPRHLPRLVARKSQSVQRLPDGRKMTAEIAVLNKWAVALAADSKVTISGMRATKAYDTANKLFTLSKFHPVGIMVFGNAEFMQYPWETIIKMYRQQKGKKSETHIIKWGEDFVKYLSKFGNIREEDREKNIENLCLAWFSQIEERVAHQASMSGIAMGSPEYVTLFTGKLKEKEKEVTSKPFWLNSRDGKAFARKYKDAISTAVTKTFGDFQNKDLLVAAVEFIIPALLKFSFSPQSSGFVIAGFGDDEIFPTIAEYHTDGFVGKRLKITEPDVADVSREMQSCIRAFAQKDMVQRFMNGVDPQLHEYITRQFTELALKSSLEVLSSYGMRKNKNDVIRKEIVGALQKDLGEVMKRTAGMVTNGFWMPVVRMIALLPKEELAHLAESLVALTSLKRKVSSDAETVGGPVDVALISKGDGFVWVKRKHYFPRELNPHFVRTYLPDVDGEQDHVETSAATGSRRSPQTGPSRRRPGSGSKGRAKRRVVAPQQRGK